MKLLLTLLLFAFTNGCISLVPARVAYRYPYPEPPPSYPPPPSEAPAPPPGHGGGGNVLRVKEIKANRVRARIIYAKEIKARDGRIGRVIHTEGRSDAGEGELNQPDVEADVIRVVEIKCDWIEADEVHAKEVKLGR